MHSVYFDFQADLKSSHIYRHDENSLVEMSAAAQLNNLVPRVVFRRFISDTHTHTFIAAGPHSGLCFTLFLSVKKVGYMGLITEAASFVKDYVVLIEFWNASTVTWTKNGDEVVK